MLGPRPPSGGGPGQLDLDLALLGAANHGQRQAAVRVAASSARCRASIPSTCWPAAATIRSPRAIPAWPPGFRPRRRAPAGRPAPAGRRPAASDATRAPAPRRRRERAAQTPRRAPAARPSRAARIRAERDDQPALEPQRVDTEQATLGVEQGAPGRAARQRRGVLDRARDPPAARARGSCGPPRRRSQGWREGRARRGWRGPPRRCRSRPRRPPAPRRAARSRRCPPPEAPRPGRGRRRPAPRSRSLLGEAHGDPLGAHVVGRGQHAVARDHRARPEPPAAPDPDHGGAAACRRARRSPTGSRLITLKPRSS